MADYALRVYRRFPQKRMVQVVIYLRPTDSELVRQTTFTANRLNHEFEVVRLWEQPTEIFLQRPGLLPYASLSQTSDRPAVLREVAKRIESLPGQQQRSNLSAASGILAALVLDKTLVRQLLRRELMRESSIYQELREEARAEARAEVQAEVLAEARAEVLAEVQAEVRLEGERSLILRQLPRRVGALPETVKGKIEALSLPQLESLGEALLDFANLSDLETWLAEQG
jgi:predicted transposase YdaD